MSTRNTLETDEMDWNHDPEAVERRWQEFWVDEDVFAYDPDGTATHDQTYAVDTPPPTVSGSLHIGHLYGHTLQDFAARFHRMRGEATFFPFGYDDNGIASERLTEEQLGIRHQDFSRREFQEKVRDVCSEYEASFTEQMQSLGVSIDWNRTYKTIDRQVQRVSQLSFVDLYEQGLEYRARAPTIWCPDCETAISQVEMEDEERDAHFHDISFPLVDPVDGRDSLEISTTRPELLPACVAIFVHPDDEDNADLVGATAEVPLFGHEVPVLTDERVDLDTGTGVVMCCTFGDQTDIEWYQAHDLPLRVAIDESGTTTELAGDYRDLSTETAREEIAADLDDAGYLLERDPITHTVQVHERSCDDAVEFLVTDQWYVELLDHKERYLAAGEQLDWYPEKMFARYEHWIEGLEWDWCISRQRDSGIPFPVWYCAECDREIIADRDQLPVEPIADDPPVERCPDCGSGEFEAEEDVFDTWATSSLTPLINAGWDWDAETGEFVIEHPELYPMTLRPQGHDIISFWLFHTVIKCLEHTGEVPFESVLVNGHVLDENREKMSSSKGNVVDPEDVMEEYPIDAIRYWAASTSVGDDFPFKDNELRMGEKLVQKLWNASRLVDDLTPPGFGGTDEVTPSGTGSADGTASGSGGTNGAAPDSEGTDDLETVDRWLLARLDDLVEEVTDAFAGHRYREARNRIRTFFWDTYCDNYLEVVKQRAADGSDPSATYALEVAHETFLKLLAPLIPHVTEEVWQRLYADRADAESLHVTEWPTPRGYDADVEAGERAMAVISGLRKYKSDRQLPLNAELSEAVVYGDVGGFEDAIGDVMHVGSLAVRSADEAPTVTRQVESVDLDYATLGPEYGETVADIEAAIEAGDFEVEDGQLVAADERLPADTFEVVESRTYEGEGEMVETEDAVVVVRR